MPSDPTPHEKDFASSIARFLPAWGPGIVLLLVAGNFGWWGLTMGWTVGLIWLGSFCLWNAARCGRVHCMFTGPFFLAMAVVTLLVGFRIISLGDSTWNILGAIILIGGLGFWTIPERIWGQYWRSAAAPR